MNELSWLSNPDFEYCVNNLIKRIDSAKNEANKRLIKNAPDPFWATCMAHLHKITLPKDLVSAQIGASVSTGISSAIGNFHQEILGKIKGFKNHDAGYDVECDKTKILAEIKNKHNTMNSNNRKAVIHNLQTILSSKPNYTGYLVIIIPKSPKRYKKDLGQRLYEVDGASFYSIATGSETALKDLHETLVWRLCSHSSIMVQYFSKEYSKSLPN